MMTIRPICLSFGFLELSTTPKPWRDDCCHPSYCLSPVWKTEATNPSNNLGVPTSHPRLPFFSASHTTQQVSGSALEMYIDDASLKLFKFPDFYPKVDYVLPENAFRERGHSKHRLEQLTSLNVILTVLTLTVLNTYK